MIEDLMNGLNNQNLIKAKLIKLEQENDKLKTRIKQLEDMQYDVSKFVPVQLVQTALEAQQKHFDEILNKLKNEQGRS